MKVFAKKGIIQKTIIAIIMVICINFIIPTYSNAGIGGILLSPFVDFFCSIGDACINVMQRLMTGEWGSEGGMNFSLNAFLMPSGEYYASHSVDSYDKDEVAYITINPDSSESDKKFTKGWLWNAGEYYIPVATYSPEQIFAGQVSGLDVNFINPNFDGGSADILQETIAKWYVALRNLCIVGLLCVLVYVGIRIMLSSTAMDKAKYKQMFTDWLVALCLLFFLHYIMSFILTMTESICNAIGGDGKNTIIVYDEAGDDGRGAEFQTNLLGLARFQVQYEDAGQKLTYCILYLALVVYTGIFTWHYLKRLIMMAFLTIIAPMVALTYPIDKIGDGKAQAFNMWLKEYIFNALIQPFHLIIYTVFVGSAIDLAAKNMLYSIACMAFILPAEKILKKMFGFDRAPLGTMGALTGFTAGSMASKFLGGKGGSGSKPASGGNEKSSEEKSTRLERKHGTDGIDFSNNKESKELEEPKENNKDTLSETARKALEEQEEQQREQEKQQEELARRQQLEEQENELQNGQAQLEEQAKSQNPQENGKKEEKTYKPKGRIRTGINNVINAHGGGKRIAIKGAKTLRKAAKFAAKSGFTLAGTAAGIGMGLASGQGFAGVIAGATAGKKLGAKVGNTAASLPGNVMAGGRRIASATRDTIDTFNGNTALHDKAQAKAFMKDESTEQYVRDKLTQGAGGKAPSSKEVKEEMESIQKYANEGMTDIAQIYRAKKAEKFGVSEEQSAKIALLAQDRKITSDVLGDEKKFNQRKQDFTQEFMDKGQSEAEAARNADYVLNVMKAQVGQRHNLKKASSGKPVLQIESPSASNAKVSNTNTKVSNTKMSNTKVRTKESNTRMSNTKVRTNKDNKKLNN